MQQKRNLTLDETYCDLPIMTDKKNGLGADVDILDIELKQFNYANQSKSKALFFRYDLRFPQDMEVPDDNKHFSKYISAYAKSLSRKDLKPQYVAVREQEDGNNHPHYHVAMILDGQKTQNEYGHLKKAEQLWTHELGVDCSDNANQGLVNFCQRDKNTGRPLKNGVMLQRTTRDNLQNDEQWSECFWRASYLAKEKQKNTPKGQREVFASRLPPEFRKSNTKN